MKDQIETLIDDEVMSWNPYIATVVIKSIVTNFDDKEIEKIIDDANDIIDSSTDYDYRLVIVPKNDKTPTI